MVAETALRPAELVLPVFIKEGISEPQPIGSMPGVVQHTRDSLRKAAVDAVEAGGGGRGLFGGPAGEKRRRAAAGRPPRRGPPCRPCRWGRGRRRPTVLGRPA